MARLFDNPVALVILVLIIVVVFGWKRLPDAARSLGRSTRILKSELDVDGQSRASHETVQGEAKQQPSPQTGSVPGEAPPPPADQQPPPQGQQAPGQSSGHTPGQSSGQAPGQPPGQQGS